MADLKLIENVGDGVLALTTDKYSDRLMLPFTVTHSSKRNPIEYERTKGSNSAITSSKTAFTSAISLGGSFMGKTRAITQDAQSLLTSYFQGDNLKLHIRDYGHADLERFYEFEPASVDLQLMPAPSKMCKVQVGGICNPAYMQARVQSVFTAPSVGSPAGTFIDVMNAGSEHTYPEFTIVAETAVDAGMYITNATTGQQFIVDKAMTAGQTLVINCEHLTTSLGGVGINTHVGWEFRDDFKVNRGTNRFHFQHTGNITVFIRYRQRWA